MNTIKHFALTLAFALCTLAINAQAQSLSIEVTTDSDRVQFATQGQPQAVRVEVFAPSGELLFEIDSVNNGQPLEWLMVNDKGERVADGVYIATITVTDSVGKRRKRIEQITVSSPKNTAQTAGASQAGAGPTPNAAGVGTLGKIAKWTDNAGTLGNSVITESAGKVGIGTTLAPTAILQVNGSHPADSALNGTAATALLQTSGGQGGNTTVSDGKVAGAGASVSLVAGNGGDAPTGSKRGNGGNIVLQPGSTGGGTGTAGLNGNVLIASSGVGNVAVGTNTPTSRLTVNGMIQSTGAGGGIKFPDGSVQTKAATTGLSSVAHNTTLTGSGTSASPLGAAVPLNLTGSVALPGFALKVTNNSGNGILGVGTGGNGVVGTTLSSSAVGVYGENKFGGLAGKFDGKVEITKQLSVDGAVVRTVVDGIIVWPCGSKTATIPLPPNFEATHKDFRYQLTLIVTDDYALVAPYIVQEISNNQFKIQSYCPPAPHPIPKISWQVSAVPK